MSYINIYHLFASQYIISFLSSLPTYWSFSFRGEILHFQKWRWRNLPETLEWYSQHNIVDLYPSSMSQTSCRWRKPLQWKNINTKHTHTHASNASQNTEGRINNGGMTYCSILLILISISHLNLQYKQNRQTGLYTKWKIARLHCRCNWRVHQGKKSLTCLLQNGLPLHIWRP